MRATASIGHHARVNASTTSAPDAASVDLAIDGSVATVTFSHPARRNAMTLDMWLAVPERCAEIAAHGGVRVVVFRGADDTFVAGADISQFADARTGSGANSYDDTVAAATDAISALPMPTVAAVRRFCIGGGLALALAADIRYASADAKLGLPPARLGIGYNAPGIAGLVDLVGPAVTKELVYTGDPVDASTALGWGLVNRVFDTDVFEPSVAELVGAMAMRAPLSQRAAKLAVADHLAPADAKRPDTVASAIRDCFVSADYAEGVAAFMEKRSPTFTGH